MEVRSKKVWEWEMEKGKFKLTESIEWRLKGFTLNPNDDRLVVRGFWRSRWAFAKGRHEYAHRHTKKPSLPPEGVWQGFIKMWVVLAKM